MQGGIEKEKIIYRELSYKIMGIMYEVYNDLGYGYQEKIYQKAIELALVKEGIEFKPQCPYKVKYKDEIVGRYFIDIVIENKIVIEIKRGDHYSRNNFKQVIGYLKATGLELAILVNFTSTGIKYKRILNIN
jgi:GxxExxY protein